MGENFEKVLLFKIIEAAREKKITLSKIALMEIVYLLKEIFDLPFAYNYELYTYGPYSVELISDLDLLAADGLLKIAYTNTNTNGELYSGSKIVPLSTTEKFLESLGMSDEDENLVFKYEYKISRVLKFFGEKNARELEVRAAVVFLYRDKTDNKSTVIEKLLEKKPYLKREEIEEGISDLKKLY